MALGGRIIYHDKFDGTGFTNENSLANAMLTKPDVINPVITHLAGEQNKMFPLTFLTEGQKGGYDPKVGLNDVQYEWNTIGRMKNSDKIVSHSYTAGDKPGINFSYVYVVFETNWLKHTRLVMTPNGTQLRIAGKPEPAGSHYLYKFQIVGNDPSEYVSLSEMVSGSIWSMTGGAPVSESFSMGNESNVMMPGKMKNQISILRKSYRWGGNLANKQVEVQFNVDGQKTSYWMPFEEWQHMMSWKQECEEHYWYSKYNRLADGTIANKDEVNGLPIPIGAGVDAQILNRDTYSGLTYKKLKETVGDVMYGATDTGNMNVVLYTGIGGMEEFSEAVQTKASTFSQVAGDKYIKGDGDHLMLTGFFMKFKHIDGHTVEVRHLPLLDFGSRAESCPKHPQSGKPLSSYDMYFLDQSVYDGENNVKMVSQRGRSMVRGVVKGMAPLNAQADGSDFTGNNFISTEKDENSIHFLSAKGICIRRNNHCFKLSCSLS